MKLVVQLCAMMMAYAVQVPQWVARMDGSNNDVAYGVAADLQGNVAVVGYYDSSTLLIYNATGNQVGSLANSGQWGAFVVKYSSNGSVLWAARMDGTYYDSASGVAADSSGNVAVVGYYMSSPLLIYDATGNQVGSLANNNAHGTFVVKYSYNGSVLWAARMDGSGSDFAQGVAADLQGNFAVIGQYDSSPLLIYDATGNQDGSLANSGFFGAFVVKYSQNGTVLWAARMDGGSNDFTQGVAADLYGNLAVVGHYASSPLLIYDATGNQDGSLANIGFSGAFVVVYSQNQSAASTSATLASSSITGTTVETIISSSSLTTSTTTSTTTITPTTVTTSTTTATTTTTTASSTTTHLSTVTAITTSVTTKTTTTTPTFLTLSNVSDVGVMFTSSKTAQMNSKTFQTSKTTQITFEPNSYQLMSTATVKSSIDEDTVGQSQPGRQSSLMTLYIAVIAISCVLFLVLILLSKFCIRRRYFKVRVQSPLTKQSRIISGMTAQPFKTVISSETHVSNTAMGGTTFLNTSMEVAVPAYLELKLGENFRMMPNSFINKGGQAEVQVAEVLSYPAGHPFATSGIKLLAAKCFIGNVEKDSVHQEISLMWKFKDFDQIAKLVGFDVQRNILLMFNYEPGSLESLILSQSQYAQQVNYCFEMQHALCMDVVTALVILHKNAVVHNDIKSGNYLLYQDANGVLRAALTDFGVCTLQTSANFVQGLQWNKLKGYTVMYAAPEVLARLQVPEQLLPLRDVFAAAVVMFEILTRMIVWKGCTAAQVSEMVLQGLRPEAKFPDERAQMLLETIQAAWAQDPSQRPIAAEISNQLIKLVQR
ncbi:hypothetical protein MP228_004582 [Amoeboaphelidium protococcarum]|nr:hypothetical protein MP228_004582 [Amoeboaphelidium protococcarum]